MSDNQSCHKSGCGKAVGLFLFGAMLALGLIVSTYLVVQAAMHIKMDSQRVIVVKGTSERTVKSNIGKLRFWFQRRGTDVAALTAQCKQTEQAIVAYLSKLGFDPSEYILEPPLVQDDYVEVYDKDGKYTGQRRWVGYLITVSINVKSEKVDLVEQAYLGQGELTEQGHVFSSGTPYYLFTKIEDIKMDMLEDATKNARERTDRMIKNSGTAVNIDRLLSASQGAFQLESSESTEGSDQYDDDAMSMMKKVRVVVTVKYSMK